VRYIGNKQKLVGFIQQAAEEVCGDISKMSFCDLFAGSCSVSKHFKNVCSHVITNDLENYSYVLARNYIGNNNPVEYVELFIELNSLPGKVGKITKNFSPYKKCERKFFTVENAKKIDAIRQAIEDYREQEDLYYFLLCSLLESADIYSNTAGVYGAYLKDFNSRSASSFTMMPYTYSIGATGECYKEDANVLLPKLSGDILYLDPPYNSRQYGSNYHILNYIADYDFKINEKINKKTGQKEQSKTGLGKYNKSKYSQKQNALTALEDLLKNASGFRYTLMSYNNEGIISSEDIQRIFEKYGEYDIKKQNHKRYKSNNNSTQPSGVVEYIHVLKRCKNEETNRNDRLRIVS
tara:strand:+ start:6362 stop:7414 length:1053 start_codon:yes stop_codon:yes gene_type:complete